MEATKSGNHPAPEIGRGDEEPTKKAKVGTPTTLTNWKARVMFAELEKDGVTSIIAGVPSDAKAKEMVLKEMAGKLPRAALFGFGFSCADMENHRVAYKFIEGFNAVNNDRPKTISHRDWYIERTAGQSILVNADGKLRAKAKKRFGDSAFIDTMLDNAIKVGCDTNNLFHLYALFMHYPRISFEMEKLFLWLVTGTGNDNKRGVWIQRSSVDSLCWLLEAEHKFGIPVIDSEPMKCDRRHRLDLTYIIADLIRALGRQQVTGQTVSPIAPSLVCNRGSPNPVRVSVAEHYKLDVIPKGYVPDD